MWRVGTGKEVQMIVRATQRKDWTAGKTRDCSELTSAASAKASEFDSVKEKLRRAIEKGKGIEAEKKRLEGELEAVNAAGATSSAAEVEAAKAASESAERDAASARAELESVKAAAESARAELESARASAASAEAVVALADALRLNPTLQILRLGGNNLGPDGAALLAEPLSSQGTRCSARGR